ncbi:MAG TPA: extensin family protein [Bauldia sp.]|nr:extensin family protein [Bauldia sp.]
MRLYLPIAALLCAPALFADDASAASNDPLNFFDRYVVSPIQKALNAKPARIPKTKVRTTRKKADAELASVPAGNRPPVPRARPAISVSAGAVAFGSLVVSGGASGWPADYPSAGTAIAALVRPGKADSDDRVIGGVGRIDVPGADEPLAFAPGDEAAAPSPVAPVMPAVPPAAAVPPALPPVAAVPPPSGEPAPAALPRVKPKVPVKVASLPPPKGDSVPQPGGALAALGVISTPLAPIAEGDCGMPDPVAIASLDEGDVDFTTKAILNQRTAGVVALWVDNDVRPAAQSVLSGELTGLRIAASYDCRSRDNIQGARLSEHAFGNAIDISAFRVGKRWIEVGNKANSADDERFLQTVRLAACKRFTTVLGPGEPYHDTHFHLDIGKHGKTGKFRICE